LIAIIKYNAGNIRSVLHALDRIGTEAVWTDDPEVIRRADKVIFPGVGEASSAMAYLKERGLDHLLSGLHQPVLGICLGLQLFCAHSEEHDTACLDVFDEVQVRRFRPADPLVEKVPHMGWNTLHDLQGPLFEGVEAGDYVYFVHSYYAEASRKAIAQCTYGGIAFSAALQQDRYYAVQFHPEKSGPVGQRILENFVKYIN
jgi:imidazole glycerol-phosphate synthase subunit HisH